MVSVNGCQAVQINVLVNVGCVMIDNDCPRVGFKLIDSGKNYESQFSVAVSMSSEAKYLINFCELNNRIRLIVIW